MATYYHVTAMLTENQVASYQRDARRILGLDPAPWRDPHEAYLASKRGDSEYLPAPTDDIRELAESWLQLHPGQAARVWINGRGSVLMNVDPSKSQGFLD